MVAIIRISFIVAVLIDSSVEAQNLVLNGGFEAPTISGNSQAIIPTSWSGGPFTQIFNGNGGDPFNAPPIEGQQQIAVATSETLSQTFTVNVAATHTLRWFDSAYRAPNVPSVPYIVNVLSSTQQVVASASLNASHPEEWSERQLVMNLTPGNYTLRFSATGACVPGGFSPRFDNVSLLVVPEPKTIAIFAVGVAGCSFMIALRSSRK